MMNLKKTLTPDVVWIDLTATTKEDLIKEMIKRLFVAGKLADQDAALNSVLEREAKMSTGMQNGIAIPHGKSDTVKTLTVAVGIHKAGIDFNSMDGSPSSIFIMTLSPAKQAGPHIQFLAEVIRVVSGTEKREMLLACTTSLEMYKILLGK